MSQGETATSTPSWPTDTSSDAGAQLHAWVRQGRSFSGREPNCCFLNTRGPRFADVSAISGLDFADDARALGITDWDHDGDVDLWIANRSSPQVRFLRNDAPGRHHHVSFRLRGRQCNRDAVGARVEVDLGGEPLRRLVKTVRAGEGYLGQSSLWLTFGLGTAERIERVVVHWPGGASQQWSDVPIDQAYEIVQGETPLRPRPARSGLAKLPPAELQPVAASDVTQNLLSSSLPLPPLTYQDWEGRDWPLANATQTRLVVLWASWCQPCLAELQQLGQSAEAQRLRQAGVELLALSVDRVAADAPRQDGSRDPRQLLAELGYTQSAGWATADLLDKLQLVHNLLLDRHRPLPVPCSLLLEPSGKLAAIYKGPVATERVLADVQWLSRDAGARRQRSVPLAGRWFGPVAQPRPSAVAWGLVDQGDLADAVQYARDHRQALLEDDQFSKLLVHLGNQLFVADQVEPAVEQYQAALQADPQLATAHLNLAVARIKQRRLGEAEASLREAIRCWPDYGQAHYQLGVLLLQTRRVQQALAPLARAVELRPNQRDYRLALATAAATMGDLSRAAEQLEVAITADDRDASAWAQLGSVRMRQGRETDAIDCLQQALARRPDWPLVLDDLAWLLATTRDPARRDAARAVQLAEQACRAETVPHPKRLDTLAAAYAAAGRFDDAVRTAEQALQLARRQQQTRLAEGIAQRLESYRAGRPLVP